MYCLTDCLIHRCSAKYLILIDHAFPFSQIASRCNNKFIGSDGNVLHLLKCILRYINCRTR